MLTLSPIYVIRSSTKKKSHHASGPPGRRRVPPIVVPSNMELSMFNQIARITDHLFLSSAAAAKPEKIRALGITCIINMTMDIPNLNLPHLESIQIKVDDSPSVNLGVFFDRCVDKIRQVREGGGKTLVHCVAGVSRSASVCIAYMMKYHTMTLLQSYKHVKSCRSVIHPNHGFFRDLVEYERRLFGRTTVKMVKTSIGLVPDVYQDEMKNFIWISTPKSRHVSPSSSSSYVSPSSSSSYSSTYSSSYSKY